MSSLRHTFSKDKSLIVSDGKGNPVAVLGDYRIADRLHKTTFEGYVYVMSARGALGRFPSEELADVFIEALEGVAERS